MKHFDTISNHFISIKLIPAIELMLKSTANLVALSSVLVLAPMKASTPVRRLVKPPNAPMKKLARYVQ